MCVCVCDLSHVSLTSLCDHRLKSDSSILLHWIKLYLFRVSWTHNHHGHRTKPRVLFIHLISLNVCWLFSFVPQHKITTALQHHLNLSSCYCNLIHWVCVCLFFKGHPTNEYLSPFSMSSIWFDLSNLYLLWHLS